MPTLADSLAEAARLTPRGWCWSTATSASTVQSLHTQARALAQALLSRMPTGSVVSFMLPNWHEAAVVYLASTMAGIAVNPILPSLRDRELRFILDDVDSRMIFVPSEFRQHDYLAMVDRVTGRRWTHRPRSSSFAASTAITPPTAHCSSSESDAQRCRRSTRPPCG